ncbi:MBOAT family O-acyltransferase [Syntrophomonas erecta]
MLFNSYEYIFAFLPLMLIGYFFINWLGRTTAARVWLVAGSLFFYSWWNIAYLPLIVISILINYRLGSWLGKDQNLPVSRKNILITGLVFNIGLLGYFKYADFFINNVNFLFSTHIKPLGLLLPLAISFFTFQQIAYLVDAYRQETREYNLLNYALFVSFFPQLIAGPIVHHREMMGQFNDPDRKTVNTRNIAAGIFLFFIGLAKKVLIADTFAIWATYGFDTATYLTLLEGWIVSLSYTFQLYFDFSGYTDMAIGAALMFNIRLPINFSSPYKALSIQDFWRRWHMTLGRFLRNYIYIPLGGNRQGPARTYRNLMLTFLIGGLWHGAGWTFVFWGFLHGVALVINRAWQKLNLKMNHILAWFITFNFVNVAWVFFRATTWEDAIKVLRAMLGLSGVKLPESLAYKLSGLASYGVTFGGFSMEEYLPQALPMVVVFMAVVLIFRNTMQMKDRFRPGWLSALVISILGIASIVSLTRVSEFLYFNF